MLNKISPCVLQTFSDYSPIEIMAETFGVIAIDLLRCSTSETKQENEIFLPPPEGVYSTSSIEPILNFQHDHYFSYGAQVLRAQRPLGPHPILPDIRNYDDYMSAEGPIFNTHGKQVALAISSIKRCTSPVPLFNYGAIHAAFISLWDHFNMLSNAIKPVTNAPQSWLNYESYVKPEHLKKPLYLFDAVGYHDHLRLNGLGSFSLPAQVPYAHYEEGAMSWDPWGNPGLRMIYEEQVDPFIGRDVHRMYRLNLQGSTLYIEKGHDIRVIELQRMIWDHMESIRYETDAGNHRP